MTLPELGHTSLALVGVTGALHLVLIFLLAVFLQRQMRLFLPGFVDLVAFAGLFDLAATLIPLLSNHLALSVDSLERVPLLD